FPFNRPARPDIMELLQQKKYWVPADGTMIKLKDMHHAHRANLLAWVEPRARYLQTADAIKRLAFEDANSLDGRSWSPDLVLERELMAQGSVEWLNSWPLIKRLRKLVDAAYGQSLATWVAERRKAGTLHKPRDR